MKTNKYLQKEFYNQAEKLWVETFNVKPGTKVKVLTKAGSRQLGWCNGWNPNMDSSITRILRVKEIEATNGWGIRLEDSYYYPYFCLEVEGETEVVTEIAGMSTVIRKDGTAKVGCTELSKEEIENFIQKRVILMAQK